MHAERQYRGSLQQVVVRPNVVGAPLVEWSGGPVGLFPSERFLKILLALPAYASYPYAMHTTSTGRFTMTPDSSDIKAACEKARLARVLSAPVDAAGNWEVSQEDQCWAIRVCMSKPAWAVATLTAHGIR